MKWICAWCKKVGEDVEPLDDDRVTHGMCKECAKGMKKEAKELMDCSDILYPELQGK